MTNVYLIHGFNVRDGGNGGIDLLIPDIERKGYTVRQVDYLWWGRVMVRLCAKSMAKAISGMVEPGSVVIGHSNGGYLAYLAAHYGAPFEQMILINPALDHDAEFPDHVGRIDVFHDSGDLWPRLARYIPFSGWGDMGTVGYEGSDDRVSNHRHWYGHSGLFMADPKRVVALLPRTV